jgi:hypothetical protein
LTMGDTVITEKLLYNYWYKNTRKNRSRLRNDNVNPLSKVYKIYISPRKMTKR